MLFAAISGDEDESQAFPFPYPRRSRGGPDRRRDLSVAARRIDGGVARPGADPGRSRTLPGAGPDLRAAARRDRSEAGPGLAEPPRDVVLGLLLDRIDEDPVGRAVFDQLAEIEEGGVVRHAR